VMQSGSIPPGGLSAYAIAKEITSAVTMEAWVASHRYKKMTPRRSASQYRPGGFDVDQASYLRGPGVSDGSWRDSFNSSQVTFAFPFVFVRHRFHQCVGSSGLPVPSQPRGYGLPSLLRLRLPLLVSFIWV
jgi:hypothetical protein